MIKMSLTALAAVAALVASPVSAQETHEINLSLDTSPNHVRNISIMKWADYLNEQSDGRLKVNVFHSAAQYSDANVPKALGQCALDMGAPGWWVISKYLPELNLLGLPMAYGADRETIYEVMDGPIGEELNQMLEDQLRIKVLGRHFDLGYGQMFFAGETVENHDDLQALKIRTPGGAANVERMKVFGANPTTIAWPDVPQALQRGVVDGVLTTYESSRSAKLWDSGITNVFEDNQVFYQYIPMMCQQTWDNLPEDLQQLMENSWEERIDELREAAAERQNSAREENIEGGVERVQVTDEEFEEWRGKLMEQQPVIVEALDMDEDFVQRAQEAFDAARGN